MDGHSDNSGGKDQGGSQKTPAETQSQFEAIVASQQNTGKAADQTFGDVFALALGA